MKKSKRTKEKSSRNKKKTEELSKEKESDFLKLKKGNDN